MPPLDSTSVETKIRCDCHGKVVMAVVRNDKLVIRRNQHGRTHTAVILLDNDKHATLDSSHN